ncbi:histidine kinase N-terminal 7TM domain-containing protein [Roseiflexus castenholzii]|nr:histidine kinase N-terminal 7TM domain-containing protein [Roseiflexus castenholzii]
MMAWLLPVFIAFLLIAALMETAVALYAWRQRMTAGATQLVLLMAAAIVWTLAYGLTLISASLPTKLLWLGVAHLGIVFLPVLYLRFAIAYTRRAAWLWRWRGAPWYIVPIATIALNWTNTAHGLYYQDVALLQDGPFVLLHVTPGPWIWVFAVYSYALIASGALVFWRASREASSLQRGQATMVAISAFVPWIANLLQLLEWHPLMPLDITPLALSFSGLALLWGMFRYRLFTLAPIAREYVVELMSDAVIVLNARNRIIDMNPAAQRLFAPDGGSLFGQPVETLLKPWTALLRACHEPGEQVLEITWQQRIFEVKITPLIGQEGSVNGRLLIWRNITQRKHKQALLRNRLHFIQLIQQAANDCVRCEVAQIDDQIISVLEKVVRFTGVERSYLFLIAPEGDHAIRTHEWVHPAVLSSGGRRGRLNLAEFMPVIEPMRRGEIVVMQRRDVPETPEYEAVRRAFNDFGIQTVVGIPLFIGAQFIGWIGFDTVFREFEPSDAVVEAFQLTGQLIASAIHRQRIEAALRQREQHFRSLFDNMFEGVALHRLVRDDNGRMINYEIIDVNVQYERILNLRREDVVHRLATEVYGTPEPPYLAEFGAVAATGRPAHLEVYFEPMQKHFFISVSPLGPDQFATIFFDVTARKQEEAEREQLQTQLMHAQRLEAIGRLAGGVAHDFNNILTVISGSADLALTTLPSDSPAYPDIQAIQQSARRATHLVRQLLTFARRQPSHPQTIDVNALIDGMVPLILRLIGEDIRLTWMPAPHPCPIRIDPHQFEQVLMNLIVNARDAMPEGGALVIATSQTAPTGDIVVETPYIRISVQDTGVGIPVEVKAHIFEPYFTTKAPGQGAGLGLATCLGIVQQHAGFIRCESQPGQGARFDVYLPYASGESSYHQDAELDSQPERGQETILVVEDEPAVRSLAVRILRDHGYTVFEASNGREAQRVVETLPGHALHLLLTDLVMPEMSGVELATWVQARCPGVSVLFMSGYARQVTINRDNPGVAFLQKPFSRRTLLSQVRCLLDAVAVETSG